MVFGDGSDSGSETTPEEIIRRAATANVTIYALRMNPGRSLFSRRNDLPGPGPIDTNIGRPTPPGGVPTPTAADNVYGKPIPLGDILGTTGKVLKSAIRSNPLETYAEHSGGVYFSQWSGKALSEHLTRIATEIQSQYDLAYIPNNQAEPGYHRIEIKVKQKGMKVRTRAGYYTTP